MVMNPMVESVEKITQHKQIANPSLGTADNRNLFCQPQLSMPTFLQRSVFGLSEVVHLLNNFS